MTLTRGVITTKDGKTIITPLETTFELPLLTIMPINSLGVDNVSVDFEMEVKSRVYLRKIQDEKDIIRNIRDLQ